MAKGNCFGSDRRCGEGISIDKDGGGEGMVKVGVCNDDCSGRNCNCCCGLCVCTRGRYPGGGGTTDKGLVQDVRGSGLGKVVDVG